MKLFPNQDRIDLIISRFKEEFPFESRHMNIDQEEKSLQISFRMKFGLYGERYLHGTDYEEREYAKAKEEKRKLNERIERFLKQQNFCEYVGYIEPWLCSEYGEVRQYQFSTHEVKEVSIGYHLTKKENVEDIIEIGILPNSAEEDRWRSRKYKGVSFFCNDIEKCLRFMHFNQDYVALEVNLEGIQLFFDAGFDGDGDRYGDFESYMTFEEIKPARILKVIDLYDDLSDLLIDSEMASDLIENIWNRRNDFYCTSIFDIYYDTELKVESVNIDKIYSTEFNTFYVVLRNIETKKRAHLEIKARKIQGSHLVLTHMKDFYDLSDFFENLRKSKLIYLS